MKPSHDGRWHELPLESTHLSQAFAQTAMQNGYTTVGQLLAIPLTDVLDMAWFTPAMFTELVEFVKQSKGSLGDPK